MQHLLHGIPKDTVPHPAFIVGLFSQNGGKTGGEIASRTICECLFRCGVSSSCVLCLKAGYFRNLGLNS